MDAAAKTVFERVLAAMQDAEEIGGPEGDSYRALMETIAAEATKRRAAFLKTLAVPVDGCTLWPLWQREFGGGYAIPSEVVDLVKRGLAVDLSWHNDVCPSFGVTREDSDGVRLWVEHPDTNERENGPETPRYAVCFWDADENQTTTYEGDDLAVALAAYTIALTKLKRGCSAVCDCHSCRPELYVGGAS